MNDRAATVRRGDAARFRRGRVDAVTLDCAAPLSGFYKLSPFVWKTRDGFEILIRAVNHSNIAAQKVARVYHGVSPDGLHFTMDGNPVITPGQSAFDRDGCEDPTMAMQDGTYYVYYTGWDQTQLRGELLLATGNNIHDLVTRGIAIPATDLIRNPKEATIQPAADGSWRLFFEYAQNDASRIGVAQSQNVDGPWTVMPDLFAARADAWDSWHLSTGPVITLGGKPMMFYNGANRQAHWRIGWVEFDPAFNCVVARCDEPVIMPHGLRGEDTDIAFAASCVQIGDARCDLYYSVADRSMYRVSLLAEPAVAAT